MVDRSISGWAKIFTILIAAALLMIDPASAGQQGDNRTAQVLADLAARILTSSLHPCLGESEKDVRRLLKGKIVSDGIFDYSDLAVAYPATKDVLKGLVEWDFDSGLDTVSLKITDFHVGPSVLIDQVEQALPGCNMGQEASDCVMEDAERDDEDDETQEWWCLAEVEGTDGVLVEVYLVPGLVLFEIGS